VAVLFNIIIIISLFRFIIHFISSYDNYTIGIIKMHISVRSTTIMNLALTQMNHLKNKKIKIKNVLKNFPF
jgi:hypothetical protein